MSKYVYKSTPSAAMFTAGSESISAAPLHVDIIEIPSDYAVYTSKNVNTNNILLRLKYDYSGPYICASELELESKYNTEDIYEYLSYTFCSRIMDHHKIDMDVRKYVYDDLRKVFFPSTSMSITELIANKDDHYYKTGETPESFVDVSTVSKKLPGMNYICSSPCSCSYTKGGFRLWNTIQHLNDKHAEWTRERIADWLDELADTGKVNLDFDPWKEDQ